MSTLKSITLTAVAASFLLASVQSQNLFKQRRNKGSLIADTTAGQVGDILSVLVSETSNAKNEDKVARSNSTTLAAQLESFNLADKTFKTNTLPEIDIRQSRSFDGEGKQEVKSSLTSRIAVMVIDVLPNGNMVISGSREVTVNDEKKTLKISGIIRRLDITSTNTVQSSMVADARISITSEGGNARMVTRGPVSAFVDTLIWFAWPF